ncbi:hypothetical protein K469DRAFT_695716 [Zopfia rhizophila CBS 207.26]|uniref:Uncharacterized protein n=1 Tax=Zopfia rhizophila CBS 207.26 TaxID=1314779 RepID=A0A6A6DJT6_9PEZI|nr:hypothetical protein K469DRAFT_695716 [Zopfia rhizophila CBS 207.26]
MALETPNIFVLDPRLKGTKTSEKGLVRATFNDSEGTQVVTPQMDTEGTSNCPIVLDDDPEEDTDMEDEDEADEPILNDDHPKEDKYAKDGEQPITNGDGSEDVDAEGSGEDIDAIGQERPITNDNSSKDVDAEDGDQANVPIPNDDGFKEAEHKEKRGDMVRTEWANVQELWTEEYQREVFYGFKRLWGFNEEMKRAHSQKHNNLRPGEARKFCSQWKEIKQGLLPVVHGFGQTLVRLQEVEAERQSGAISIGDGDKNDDDYVPRGRSGRSGRSDQKR